MQSSMLGSTFNVSDSRGLTKLPITEVFSYVCELFRLGRIASEHAEQIIFETRDLSVGDERTYRGSLNVGDCSHSGYEIAIRKDSKSFLLVSYKVHASAKRVAHPKAISDDGQGAKRLQAEGNASARSPRAAENEACGSSHGYMKDHTVVGGLRAP
jgi:hypothetical protein